MIAGEKQGLSWGIEIDTNQKKKNEIENFKFQVLIFKILKGVMVENTTSFDKISAKTFVKMFIFLIDNGLKRVEIMRAT